MLFREDGSPATTTNLSAALTRFRSAVLNLIRFHEGKAGVARTMRRFNVQRKLVPQAIGGYWSNFPIRPGGNLSVRVCGPPRCFGSGSA